MKGFIVFCLLILGSQADETYEDILWTVRSGFVEYERELEQTLIRMAPIEFTAVDQMIKTSMDFLADTIDLALDLGGMASDLVSIIDENNGTVNIPCLIPVGVQSLSLVSDSAHKLFSCEEQLLQELGSGEEPYLNATEQLGEAQAFAYTTFESCVRSGVYNIANLQSCFEKGLTDLDAKVKPIKSEIIENALGLTHLKKHFEQCTKDFKTSITQKIEVIVDNFKSCEEKEME